MSSQFSIKGNNVVQEKEYPGILKAEYQYEIKSTKASYTYTGPKISQEEWSAVLSFFRWTWDTTKSESQVRGYINPSTSQVKFWAFPQEARTGMTAREVDTPEMVAQRQQFGEGWQYFITVHHHCSASAFQSGTDASNEQTIDGLHITVGNIDAATHTLDARFYLNKDKFTVNLDQFWDVGEEAKRLVPPELWSTVAKFQMCQAKPTAAFPDQWRENLIEVKTIPAVTTYGYGTGPYRPSGGNGRITYGWKPDGEEAVEYILDEIDRANNMTVELFNDFLENILTYPEAHLIVDAALLRRADLEDISKHWKKAMEKLEKEESAQVQANTQSSHVSAAEVDWEGYMGQ